MRKREIPIWFKVETFIFLFFLGAVSINYFKISQGSNNLDVQFVLMKLVILMSVVLLIWLISLIVYCQNK